jgi:hypothetical protein
VPIASGGGQHNASTASTGRQKASVSPVARIVIPSMTATCCPGEADATFGDVDFCNDIVDAVRECRVVASLRCRKGKG